MKSELALIYRTRARNIARESENKIHDDGVAASFGFRGGLVPGVAVYGYMTVPIVQQFGIRWLESGTVTVRFQRPLYEGDLVTVRGVLDQETNRLKMHLTAERENGEICATATAGLDDHTPVRPAPETYPTHVLPALEARLVASRDEFARKPLLGSLEEKLDLATTETELLKKLDERISIYFGEGAVAHPALLLGLANQIFTRNYALGPWIHASSEVTNWSTASHNELLSVRGRVADCFERKGHEFVVLDLLLSCDERLIQHVRHSAIYRLSNASSQLSASHSDGGNAD